MNDMPHQAQFGAAPAAPSGLSRVLPWARTAATGGVLVALAVYGLQVGLPEVWRPSSVTGDMAGETMRHEIQAVKAEKIDLERRLADATAQANAKAQADLMVMQQTLATTTASVDPLAQLAGTADVLCAGGRAVAAMTVPDGHVHGDWRGISTSDDSMSGMFNQLARVVAGVSCGMSTPLRDTARAVQIDAVRQVAQARGMPMTNGAVQASAEDQLEARAWQAIDSVTTASRHYDYADVVKVQKWADQLPGVVQAHLKANLPSNNTGWDVFVDRARAFEAVVHPNG